MAELYQVDCLACVHPQHSRALAPGLTCSWSAAGLINTHLANIKTCPSSTYSSIDDPGQSTVVSGANMGVLWSGGPECEQPPLHGPPPRGRLSPAGCIGPSAIEIVALVKYACMNNNTWSFMPRQSKFHAGCIMRIHKVESLLIC